MFTELMPLLAGRTVLITVARESDTTVRATVIPKRAKEGENAVLATPLSFVGTPEELDRDFAKELTAYVDTHQQLSSTLARAKATMEAAAKAAQEEAKRKADERRKAKPSNLTPAPASTTHPAASASSDPAPTIASNLFGATQAEPSNSEQKECRLSL